MALGRPAIDPRAAAGDLLIVGLPANDIGSEREALDFIEEIKPWGVVLFARNAPSSEAFLSLTTLIAKRFPEILLGAGTLLEKEQVIRAKNAGHTVTAPFTPGSPSTRPPWRYPPGT